MKESENNPPVLSQEKKVKISKKNNKSKNNLNKNTIQLKSKDSNKKPIKEFTIKYTLK